MKEYGLIGFPLGHSFSQKYFTQKFEREHIDGKYSLFAIESIDQLPHLLENKAISGLNVTIPYKEQIIPYLDGLDESAASVGAVNVVKVTYEGNIRKLIGFNSDVYGFMNSIRPMLCSQHTKALVLGTGGASKAVASVFKTLGVEFKYVSRRPCDNILTYNDLSDEVIKSHLIIVNATPLGMFPKINECPAIPYNYLTSNHVAFDLIYNPDETLFLKKAAEQGAKTKNGLEMLYLQADRSWEIWTE